MFSIYSYLITVLASALKMFFFLCFCALLCVSVCTPCGFGRKETVRSAYRVCLIHLAQKGVSVLGCTRTVGLKLILQRDGQSPETGSLPVERGALSYKGRKVIASYCILFQPYCIFVSCKEKVPLCMLAVQTILRFHLALLHICLLGVEMTVYSLTVYFYLFYECSSLVTMEDFILIIMMLKLCCHYAGQKYCFVILCSPTVVADCAVLVIKRGTCQLNSVRKRSDSAMPALFTLACAWSMWAHGL